MVSTIDHKIIEARLTGDILGVRLEAASGGLVEDPELVLLPCSEVSQEELRNVVLDLRCRHGGPGKLRIYWRNLILPTRLAGHDPCLMPEGLHTKNQTTNPSVPELVGASLGLSSEDDALGEGD